MSTAPAKSPAVVSMRQDQAEQRARGGQDDLGRDLEDAFLASDPVSHTTTTIPTGRVDAEEAQTTAVRSRQVKSNVPRRIERRVREKPLTSPSIDLLAVLQLTTPLLDISNPPAIKAFFLLLQPGRDLRQP